MLIEQTVQNIEEEVSVQAHPMPPLKGPIVVPAMPRTCVVPTL
jgi:hypothetical protein